MIFKLPQHLVCNILQEYLRLMHIVKLDTSVTNNINRIQLKSIYLGDNLTIKYCELDCIYYLNYNILYKWLIRSNILYSVLVLNLRFNCHEYNYLNKTLTTRINNRLSSIILHNYHNNCELLICELNLTNIHKCEFNKSNAATDNLIHIILNYSKIITEIHLSECSLITDFAICDIAHRCKKLKILSIYKLYNVTNSSLYEIAYNCSHIEILTLNISNSKLFEIFNIIKHSNNIIRLCINTKTLSIEELFFIIKDNPNLTHLIIEDCCKFIIDDLMVALITNLKKLKKLIIYNFFSINLRNVDKIIKKCNLMNYCFSDKNYNIVNMGDHYHNL